MTEPGVLKIKTADKETIVAVYNRNGFLMRIWETEDIRNQTASVHLNYDEVEKLRDEMSRYLIEYWPQEDDE
jgi:hypothetical protein